MTTPKRLTLTYLALTAGLLVLFGMNLLWGSVSLTPEEVLSDRAYYYDRESGKLAL